MSNTAQINIRLSNGTEAGKTINELTAQSAKLAREIKKLEVGSEDFEKATQDWQKVKERLDEVKKEAFSTAKAQEQLSEETKQAALAAEEMAKKAEQMQKEIEHSAEAQSFLNSTLSDMIPFKTQYEQLNKIVTSSNTAFLKGASGAKVFKIALAATGVGLLVVALGTLVTWLTKTQKGMDFVGKVTAAAGAAFQVIIDRVLTFGQAMVDLVSGNFAAAVDGLKASFSGLGEEIKNETAAAYEMEGAMQDIVRAEKQIELQRSRSRAEIERLKMASEDQTKSEQERLAAAQKAFDLENELLAASIELQERKLNLIREQNAQGTSTDEDLNREYDAEIELNNLREESFTKQTELQNKINALKQSGAAITRETTEEEVVIVEESLQKILDLEIAAAEKQKALGDEALEAFKAQRQADFESRMEELVSMNEAEQNMINQLFLTNQIGQEERDQMLYDQQKKALEDRMALLIANGEQSSQAYQDIYMNLLQLQYDYEQKQTQQTQQEEAKRRQLRETGLATAAGIFAGFAQLLSDNAKNQRKNLMAIKAAQTAEVAIASAVEIQNIWKNANAFPVPFNTIIGVAQTAIALGRAKAAINQINNTDIQGQSFADGGVVYGPSHSAGGVPFSVQGRGGYEMEGNEIILSKGVYQNPVLRSLASDLNVLGGGRSFALGGPVLQDRGLVNTGDTSQIRAGVDQAAGGSAANFQKMEMLLLEIARNTRDTADKPPLALTEIEAGLNTLQDVRTDATF